MRVRDAVQSWASNPFSYHLVPDLQCLTDMLHGSRTIQRRRGLILARQTGYRFLSESSGLGGGEAAGIFRQLVPLQFPRMLWARVGNGRSRHRKRHLGGDLRSALVGALGANLGGDFGRLWRPHLPLTHAKALPALDQIEMDVAFVIAVGARSEHRRETTTGAVAYFVTEFFCSLCICQAQRSSIGENERAQVDSIRPSMLAELAACQAIAPAAFESIIGFHRAQRCAKLVRLRCGLVAQPAGERFRKCTAQYRSRFEFDA